MSQEPMPAWLPSQNIINQSNLFQSMKKKGFKDYRSFHAWSYQNQQDFIQDIIQQLQIVFDQPFSSVLDVSNGLAFPNWFKDANLNISKSCFNADPDSIAIIERNEAGKSRSISYGELDKLSNQIASAILKHYQPKDRFAIIMPMTIEAVALHLGMVKAGCTTVGIAESFSKTEIETRLAITAPKAIFTQDYLTRNQKKMPLYENLTTLALPMVVIETAGNVSLRKTDKTWQSFISEGDQHFDPILCQPNDYTIILFSSGTTGDPKAIPWTHTTPIKCASDAFFHHDLKPDDRFLWPTSLGWMMGAWLIYAVLINRATITLFDGSPNLPLLGEFIEQERITHVGVVPTLVKSWRTNKCMEGFDWSAVKLFTSTGECSNADDMTYLMTLADNKPIIEYCGGTEIGGAYITSTLIEPNAPASFTTPAVGLNFTILNHEGEISDEGEVAILAPALGLSTELLNSNHYDVYYANMPKAADPNFILRRHGDLIVKHQNGFYQLLGRADDTLNLSGIKISCVEIERVLINLPNVKEVAVIGVSPLGGGPSLLVLFIVLLRAEQKNILKNKLQQAIKEELNPLFKIYDIEIVSALPRTASNKILRRFLKKEYEKKLIGTK